ncbi:serine/threonine protein kinase [Calothrix parasitica NIES-267]|uniref:non-specific serine/threonine protein kinase n=1 Tax=Calothrix parasitica NIES-267 TaxID=1973488 RepID=A0A1Z4LZI4_9CYAN|nr:serine/threonine protein kinase [Calothrix parasitica NIES-267]
MDLYKSGEVINQKYRILDILGKGGIGITYLAENLETNKNLALKVLFLRRINDWKKIELFEREGQILYQLNHPAIPSYFDYFKIETDKDNSFYIAQQLAPGKSLQELIESGWNPDESEVKDIAIQILDILIYLHSFSPPIIHRDIKPQNIIRDENGKVFLVDFGAVADTYHNTVTGGSTVVGTFGYMAPEQFRGKAFPSTDLYGLGTTLLYLLTKKHPSDLPQKHLKIDFRSQINVSQNFADWLNKLIEPVAEDRFTNAEIALAVLQGKEALDNYLTKRPRKPKHTSIRLQKNRDKLQIDIPSGNFQSNYRLILTITFLVFNGFLLLIFLTVIQYFSFMDFPYIVFFICFLVPCLIVGCLKFSELIINPLSNIKYIIIKNKDFLIFSYQKKLFFWHYHISEETYRFGSNIFKKYLRKRLDSMKFSLTINERRWLKSEIDNFIK